jgi:hypothetical protein
MTDAPVFVVGVARSGTTLLSAMLSAHSRLDCGPESRFFARYRHVRPRGKARILDPVTWPRPAVDFIASLRNQGHPIPELFGLTLPEIGRYLADRQPSEAAMLESLTVLHAQNAAKARWIEKTPRHLLMIDTLRQQWPEAYVVRIVRDPRDAALSLAGMPFAKDSVVGNLVRVDQDDRISRPLIEVDPWVITLRYEDLVAEPERELRRICSFIGEDFEPTMLSSRETAGNVAAEHEWWKTSVAGPITASSVGRWHDEMSADARRFAGLHLAGYLTEHGYEGAEDPRGEIAVLPVADAVGTANEALLLLLARRGLVVTRPAPIGPRQQHVQRDLVFLGVRGQLDPTRGQSVLRRALGTTLLTVGLLVRRLQGRPMLWIRSATPRVRAERDPVERLLVGPLRLLAQEVPLEEATAMVDPGDGDASA